MSTCPLLFIYGHLHHWFGLTRLSWYLASTPIDFTWAMDLQHLTKDTQGKSTSGLWYNICSSLMPTSSGPSVLKVKPLKWWDGVLLYLDTFAMYMYFGLMFASPQLLFYCLTSILLHAPEVHSPSILLQSWLQKLIFLFTVQTVYIVFNSLSQILVFNHKTSAGGLPHRTVFSNT